MSLAQFDRAARWHFANPPATWTVHKVDARTWQVRALDGTVIDRCTTKTAAEQSRLSGNSVRLWQERTDWYLGRSTNPRDRPLTPEERGIIDAITRPDTARETIRAARFCDRCDQDDQTWIVSGTPDGRWAIAGLPWWSFAAEELEFLADDDPASHEAMFDELFAAIDRWDRQLTDDLCGDGTTTDAAVTVIAILRRLVTT